MGQECNRLREIINVYKNAVGSLKEIDRLGHQRINGRIILKWTLKK
jgi:hypothetical protein